jgi:hypothetical protein
MGNLINTTRVIKPIVFKSKDISLGNICAYLNFTRQVIRSDPSKRKNHGVRILIGPGHRSKKPIHLL